jgi:hypothetical protein
MPRFMDRFARQNPNRASTRVSPGFTLPKHSSPSFGSDRRRSYSNPSENIRIGRWCAPRGAPTGVRFHYAQGLVTRTLAPPGDSLVRVSRRAAGGHYASVLAPGSAVLGRRQRITRRAVTLPWGSHVRAAFQHRRRPTLARARRSAPAGEPVDPPGASLATSASPLAISRTV